MVLIGERTRADVRIELAIRAKRGITVFAASSPKKLRRNFSLNKGFKASFKANSNTLTKHSYRESAAAGAADEEDGSILCFRAWVGWASWRQIDFDSCGLRVDVVALKSKI